MNKLPELLQPNLAAIQTNEISIYKGELSTKCVISNIAKLKKAFPTLPAGFYDVFSDRLIANGFCDTRLNDAVSDVIDNCIYPTPTIGTFISFDRKFKVYHYHDMIKMSDEIGSEIWNSYKPVAFPERETTVWVHVDYIKRYNLNQINSKSYDKKSNETH